ncbi:hypothetical protein E2C01_090096 [Portunus trituberculatus]|uniref:Uncharacterized protein n=1 Tax=Portunus trituberculatus TaxID=210409 RepID=A0A5B7JKZ6_PORTR|nr:hypothetical protein [Portunus trituberculatus]
MVQKSLLELCTPMWPLLTSQSPTTPETMPARNCERKGREESRPVCGRRGGKLRQEEVEAEHTASVSNCDSPERKAAENSAPRGLGGLSGGRRTEVRVRGEGW